MPCSLVEERMMLSFSVGWDSKPRKQTSRVTATLLAAFLTYSLAQRLI
jgi:hypothetical protein